MKRLCPGKKKKSTHIRPLNTPQCKTVINVNNRLTPQGLGETQHTPVVPVVSTLRCKIPLVSTRDSTMAHWFYSLLFLLSFLPSLDTEHCVPQQNCFRMAPVHILYCTLHLGNRHFVSTNHLAHLQAHTHTHTHTLPFAQTTHWQIIKQNCFCTFTLSVAHTRLSACCHYRMRVKRFNTDLDSCNRWGKKRWVITNHISEKQ